MPTVSTEIEDEVTSILTVTANKEVRILQSEPEIARSPKANVSDRITPNTQSPPNRNEILYEESHCNG